MIEKTQNTYIEPWKLLYPERKQRYESLDECIKILLLNDIQGTGKTISALRIAFKNNTYTISFVNDHELAIEIINGWMKYNESFDFAYLVSRTYPLTEEQKEIITFILGLDELPQSYTCNMCEDKKFFEYSSKGYLTKGYCKECIYRKNRECVYYLLKSLAYQKKDVFDDNKLLVLVKPYLYTNYIKSLLKKHKESAIIFDEGFFQSLYDSITFSEYKKMKNYIIFIDNIVKSHVNLEKKWEKVRDILELMINFDKTKIKPKDKKNTIYALLTEFKKTYGLKEIENWQEDLKISIHIEHDYGELKYMAPNMFVSFQKILTDIYNIDDKKIYERMFVNKDNLHFTYVAETRNSVVEVLNKCFRAQIPSSAMKIQLFESALPEFKDRYVLQKDETIKSLFKTINIYTRGFYTKNSLFNPYKNEFTQQYYNLLEVLKGIILKHRNQKIFIVAFKMVKKQLIKDLKDFLKINNIKKENIAFGHYYNEEGKNKYEDFDVGVLFGSCGIPKELLKAISSVLKISIAILNNYFIEDQMYQIVERLRSVNNPNEKIIYQLSKIRNYHYPAEQITLFRDLYDKKYKEFLKKLKNKGLSNVKVCLEIYNSCKYNKITKINNFYPILNELEEQGIISTEKRKMGNYRPVSHYKVII